MWTEKRAHFSGGPLRQRAGLVILLWLLFVQALMAARAASITFDEGPHLAVGYATLRTGDLRLQPIHIHPPLANVLAAAPLLANPDLPDPRGIAGWEIASLSAVTDAVVWRYPHPAQLALAGRLPIILLTVLTGALVFRWAADWGGARAGLLALALYTLDPNILAHGSVITTDMAVTCFGLLTFFLLHRFLGRPSRARLMGVGLALGLALASKVSAVLLLLLVGAVFVLQALWAHRSGLWASPEVRFAAPSQARGTLVQVWQAGVRAWLTVLLVTFAVLWVVYGFELRPVPEVSGSLPLPAATHLEIYRALQEHYRLGHPAFLAGQNSDQGWWYYFPLAFAIKTPLPTLIVLGIALILFVRRRGPIDLALMVFPVVYAGTALFSSVDIGYRHLLPILPFVFVFIGSQFSHPVSIPLTSQGSGQGIRKAQPGTQHSDLPSIISLALLLWLVVGTAFVQPYPLTFFNELAGGPDDGYKWLVDSNLDWGQNLWQLRDWMRDARVEQVYYSHFSPARPEVYGVTADWLPPDPRAVPFAPFNPGTGVYAIGATTLQGVYTSDVSTFAFFRQRQPEAVLGHALFVYRVPDQPTPEWAAVCFDLPLSDQQIRTGFGQADLRLLYYDCLQSQIYPTGGEGRYLLPPAADWPAGAQLVLEARRDDGRSTYNILRAGERPIPRRRAESVMTEGPLIFVGQDLNVTSVHPGQEILLQTFWQVERRSDRPLSLMAHLVGPDGVPIAVADGLGFPVEQWIPGDSIVQHHRLVVPESTPSGEYGIQTGAYWLDTLERWSVLQKDGTVNDHLLLDKITILD